MVAKKKKIFMSRFLMIDGFRSKLSKLVLFSKPMEMINVMVA